MSPRLKYDIEADAAYFRFSEGAVVESEEVRPGVVLDFDGDGKIVAMEVFGAANLLPKDTLAAA